MKLKSFDKKHDYEFIFTFENGEQKQTYIKELVAKYLQPHELDTAKINKDWGCLEFKDCVVDIEPKTLYHYCTTHPIQRSLR